MAKEGKIQHNFKRAKLVARYKVRRAELREKTKNINLTMEERLEAVQKLSDMPRNSSETRLRNRCYLSGRPRGFLRKFGLSRIAFRELALRGEVPGVMKSSW